MAKAASVQGRLLAMEAGGIWEAITPWLRTHQLAIGSVLALFSLLVGGGFYWRYQKAVALESLRQGIATLQSGDAQKAVDELQKAQSASVGNTERALGLFYLGEAYTTLGKRDDAIKSYERARAVMKRGAAESYFEQLVTLKTAQAIEGSGTEGSAAQAQKKYEQAAALDGPFQTEALAAAARLAEKLNDSVTAKTLYEKLSSVSAAHPLAEVFQGKVGK